MEILPRKNLIAPFLNKSALFNCLGVEKIQQLAQVCYFRQAPKGSVVFFQDDTPEGVYIVFSGWVAILLANFDGREFVINEMRPGDFFGELSLITGMKRSTTAMARGKSELIFVPGHTFLTLIKSEPEFIHRLLKITAERLYLSTERERALAFKDAPGRLARILLSLDQMATDKGYLTVSQDELAQRTGLTRQTVAKIIGRWRRLGWLITGRGRIVLLDHQALKQIDQQVII